MKIFAMLILILFVLASCSKPDPVHIEKYAQFDIYTIGTSRVLMIEDTSLLLAEDECVYFITEYDSSIHVIGDSDFLISLNPIKPVGRAKYAVKGEPYIWIHNYSQ